MLLVGACSRSWGVFRSWVLSVDRLRQPRARTSRSRVVHPTGNRLSVEGTGTLKVLLACIGLCYLEFGRFRMPSSFNQRKMDGFVVHACLAIRPSLSVRLGVIPSALLHHLVARQDSIETLSSVAKVPSVLLDRGLFREPRNNEFGRRSQREPILGTLSWRSGQGGGWGVWGGGGGGGGGWGGGGGGGGGRIYGLSRSSP